MLRRALLAFACVGVVGTFVGIGLAADAVAPWIRTSDPTLQKIVDLPDNIYPNSSNSDCYSITSSVYGGSTDSADDCVIPTALGLAGSNGIAINGSDQEIPVVPTGGYQSLVPIPNQGMFITYSSAPVLGLYMNVYRSILDKIPRQPVQQNGRLVFPLTGGPDFMLRYNGRPLPVNTETLAFSPNGAWMVADVPYQGFIRVNMATFDITPFAPSLNTSSNANLGAQVTVTNDGRFVAIKADRSDSFMVYDVGSCNGSVLPVQPLSQKCQSRDYWTYLKGHIPNFKMIYHPRFNGSNQLVISVMHDYQIVNQQPTFKASQYMLTAPGESPLGIQYLGMGDSYASGQGAFEYVDGTDTSNNACHLSSLSYPYLLNADLYGNGHSIACSGAMMKDIIGSDQLYDGQNKPNYTKARLGALGLLQPIYASYTPGYLLQQDFVEAYDPQVITLSIGGNDIGFTDIVTRCVSPFARPTCYPTYEDQQELSNLIDSKMNALVSTYKAIEAPGRRVYVIGYPQIVVANGNCALNVHLNADEIKLFVNLTDTLNSVIAQAAAKAGVNFVDVSDAFDGHRMCETKSGNVAVNGITAGTDTGFMGLKFIGNESFHPNALGHQLLEQSILGQTGNLGSKTPVAPKSQVPFPDSETPRTGRSIRVVADDDSMAPNVVDPDISIAVATSPKSAIFRPATPVTLSLDDDTVALVSTSADATGSAVTQVTIPGTISCGYHILHANGVDLVGRSLDVSKVIFVPSDGECVSAQNPCGIIPASHVDSDKDGIDDACDPLISNPPSGPQYKVYLKGSTIHAVKS